MGGLITAIVVIAVLIGVAAAVYLVCLAAEMKD